VDSQAKTITVFYPKAPPRTYTIEHIIQDELLPNFNLSLEALFRQAKI